MAGKTGVTARHSIVSYLSYILFVKFALQRLSRALQWASMLQDFVWLQHSEGVHPPPRPQTERRSHRAVPAYLGSEVQLRQADLQALLRQAAPQGHQLQEEILRPQQQPEAQEEAEVKMVFYEFVQWNKSEYEWNFILTGFVQFRSIYLCGYRKPRKCQIYRSLILYSTYEYLHIQTSCQLLSQKYVWKFFVFFSDL